MPITLHTSVLVIGAGTAGVAAALQCARRGVATVLIGPDDSLGGMLTAAGVAATDGNELACFQTGIWRQLLHTLVSQYPVHHSWVSFFTFDPLVVSQVLADWVAQQPTLNWLPNQPLLAVMGQDNRITGAVFPDYRITADIVIEATELGDVLALGQVPHRWGWETQEVFKEPSAPKVLSAFHRQYPVQALTWVSLVRAAEPRATQTIPSLLFPQTFRHHDPERMLSYGGLGNGLYMINWPQDGNDYGVDLDRLLTPDRHKVHQEAQDHTRQFVHYLQQVFGECLGPAVDHGPEGLAQLPYYRESRRVVGLKTITELDILPQADCPAAVIPADCIAFGNYPNDHHYPGDPWPVAPKAYFWGGRWTGTPFGIPYGALIPADIEGLIVTEKNISVSHIANGATRLQPLVLNLGQVAGMAAALCSEQGCEPRDLSVIDLQYALLNDTLAPAGVVPFYDLAPTDQRYAAAQKQILQGGAYSGWAGVDPQDQPLPFQEINSFQGLWIQEQGKYFLQIDQAQIAVVTIWPGVAETLARYLTNTIVTIQGVFYPQGVWILATP